MGVEHCENTATQYGKPEEINALILKPKATLNVNVLECNLRAQRLPPHRFHYLAEYKTDETI